MENKNFRSIRANFKFDTQLSSTSVSTFFYEYLHPYSESTSTNEKVYIIIEPHEITIKKITITPYDNKEIRNTYDNVGSIKKTELVNLLVVPRNKEYTNFSTIETQLVRKKKAIKENFQTLLTDFIKDLYIYQYFKEVGDTQSLKAALEHVPLLRCIIYRHIFYYHYKEANNDTYVLKNYRKEHFEDAYLNYSKFLSQSQNERVFHKGGWFVNSFNKQKAENDLDSELLEIEKKYLEVEANMGIDEFIFSNPINLKYILKRYGVINVLKITTTKWQWQSFVYILILLIISILADIFFYNIDNSTLINIAEIGLYFTSSLFVLISFIIGGLLIKKYKSRLIPGLFLPRLVIAIVSGWLFFFTAEDILKIDFDINEWLLLGLTIIIFLVTIVFMMFEINNYAPTMSRRRTFERTMIVIGLAFVVSYTFGFWTMTHINKKFMSIDNFLVNESSFNNAFEKKIIRYEKYIEMFIVNEHEVTESLNHLNKINPFEIIQKPYDTNYMFIKKDIYKPFKLKEMKMFHFPENKVDDEIDMIKHIDSLFIKSRNDFNKLVSQMNRMLNNSLVNDNYIFKKDTISENDYKMIKFDSIDNNELKTFLKIELDLHQIKYKRFSNKLDSAIQQLKSPNEYFMENMNNGTKIKIHNKNIKSKDYDFSFIGIKKTFTTFPNMLLSRAILAMFIGIFLQLILQDKTITEPI